jgi:hypothetical protein
MFSRLPDPTEDIPGDTHGEIASWKSRRAQSLEESERFNTLVVRLASLVSQAIYLYSLWQQSTGAVDLFSSNIDTTCLNQTILQETQQGLNDTTPLVVLAYFGCFWEVFIRLINFIIFRYYIKWIWKIGKTAAEQQQQQSISKSFSLWQFFTRKSDDNYIWALNVPPDYGHNPYGMQVWCTVAGTHVECAMDLLLQTYESEAAETGETKSPDPFRDEEDKRRIKLARQRLLLSWFLFIIEDGIRFILKGIYLSIVTSAVADDSARIPAIVSMVLSGLDTVMHVFDILGVAHNYGLWIWGEEREWITIPGDPPPPRKCYISLGRYICCKLLGKNRGNKFVDWVYMVFHCKCKCCIRKPDSSAIVEAT